MSDHILASMGTLGMKKGRSQKIPGEHSEDCALPPVYLVEQRDNPSSAYYLEPGLKNIGKSVHRYDLNTLPNGCESGTSVVFVRYISNLWHKWVTHHRDSISRLIFFMDDDLFDWRALKNNSWGYRRKAWHLTARHRRWLQSENAELWVSTRYLAEKYRSWPAQILLPQSLSSPIEPSVRVFYHGSGTHHLEYQWLDPVIRKVSEQNPRIFFELIGGTELSKSWRWHSNVVVVHPMSWPAYQSFGSIPNRDIGLAPLLTGHFNDARSHTKFFDITRCGAVGIYSRHPAYTDTIRDQVDGLILKNITAVWAHAILRLAGNTNLRLRMLESAQQRVTALSNTAKNNNHGLFIDF
jgi:hypothetical protein